MKWNYSTTGFSSKTAVSASLKFSFVQALMQCHIQSLFPGSLEKMSSMQTSTYAKHWQHVRFNGITAGAFHPLLHLNNSLINQLICQCSRNHCMCIQVLKAGSVFYNIAWSAWWLVAFGYCEMCTKWESSAVVKTQLMSVHLDWSMLPLLLRGITRSFILTRVYFPKHRIGFPGIIAKHASTDGLAKMNVEFDAVLSLNKN